LANLPAFCQTLAKCIPRAANGFANVWQKWLEFAKHWQIGGGRRANWLDGTEGKSDTATEPAAMSERASQIAVHRPGDPVRPGGIRRTGRAAPAAGAKPEG
jgi:hypothetical protein